MNISALENPILGYKLDPGEPGLAHSSAASNSILRVLTQEISNWLAFKREAERNGGVIIFGGIYLNLQKRGSFLAAVSGRTTAYIYYPNKSQTVEQVEETEIKARIKQEIERLETRIQIAASLEEQERIERQIAFLKLVMNMPLVLLKQLLGPSGILLDVFA
ncbi:hypothetical protein [Pseudothermotoga thermarum]|uniref:Uncharacterized protein n=1 Tax=Pseudothermotoga thermarum DSM 5069 TaxID=688269 RepID=F7YXG8_9THEM|nr:hypothetical protein [Pseudothermotoga thermarum]AEH52005.1 hypothetical protein Theth_1965 [Pseudothermotoga thermarum DSM 5069]